MKDKIGEEEVQSGEKKNSTFKLNIVSPMGNVQTEELIPTLTKGALDKLTGTSTVDPASEDFWAHLYSFSIPAEIDSLRMLTIDSYCKHLGK